MQGKITKLVSGEEVFFDFTDKPVTPWGGLALFGGLARQVGLVEILQKHMPFVLTSPNATKPEEIVVGFLSGVLTGARRFRHVARLRSDKVVKEILGLKRMVTDVSLGRFFRRFNQKQVEEFFFPLWQWEMGRILAEVPPPKEGCVLDFDSSVFERYGRQEGAKKGHNPKKHGRPSHHPIFATLADPSVVVHAWLRSGNTGTSRGAEAFSEEAFARLPTSVKVLAVRADSGFATEPFLGHIESKGISYAVSARFTKGLQAKIALITEWEEIAPGITVGETMFQAQGWSRERRVVIVREHKPTLEEARGRQLFNDPVYVYQGIVTAMDRPRAEVWRFYRGRADMENRIKELKWDYGIDGFCTKKFYATEAVFRLVCFVHNLMVLFEKLLGLKGHRTLGTIRHTLFACGAVLGWNGGRSVLRFSLTGVYRERFLAHITRLFPSTKTNCATVGSG